MLVRTLYYLWQLERSQWLTPPELRKIQYKKLKAMMRHAYNNVPFYHKTFEAAGVKPEDIKSIDDLSKLPIITKLDIQMNFPNGIVSKGIDVDDRVKVFTSGSTGIPLTIIFNKKAKCFINAVHIRSQLECGLKLFNKSVVISDPEDIPRGKPWYEHLGILRKLYISCFDTPEDRLHILKQYRPYAIYGFPSYLWLLAKAMCERSDEKIHTKLIFTSYELLDKESRNFIESVFNIKINDVFGCNEVGDTAWECNEHVGYHINSENVVMEFTKDGENVAPGERGNITYTSLVNYAMPLIRYDVGDVGIPSNEQCPCGRGLPLIKIIEGRVGDFIITSDGKIFPPVIFFPFPFKHADYGGILQFRVIQEKTDELSFLLVVSKDFLQNSAQIFEDASRKIKNTFGETMNIRFQIVEEIPRDPSGKLRKIISKVSQTHI